MSSRIIVPRGHPTPSSRRLRRLIHAPSVLALQRSLHPPQHRRTFRLPLPLPSLRSMLHLRPLADRLHAMGVPPFDRLWPVDSPSLHSHPLCSRRARGTCRITPLVISRETALQSSAISPRHAVVPPIVPLIVPHAPLSSTRNTPRNIVFSISLDIVVTLRPEAIFQQNFHAPWASLMPGGVSSRLSPVNMPCHHARDGAQSCTVYYAW